MTISVAIATYNRAAMVREAVLAAFSQSRPPEEVVVADDASTDVTMETLAAIAKNDSRLRVLRQEKNTGGVGNWNSAIGQTRGDLIAWCSDDDRFLPGHLEASAAYLEAHREVGLVHSSFVDAVETAQGCETLPRRLRSAEPVTVDGSNLIRYLIRYYNWPFHPSTIVMRRQVWEATGGFDPAYAFFDTDWFVRAVDSDASEARNHQSPARRQLEQSNGQRAAAEGSFRNRRAVNRAVWRVWGARKSGMESQRACAVGADGQRAPPEWTRGGGLRGMARNGAG